MRLFKAAVFLSMGLAACSTTPTMGVILPQSDGTLQVQTSGIDKKEALASAAYSAQKTCEKQNKQYVVVSQNETYQGLVSESAGNLIDKAAFFSGALLPSVRSNNDYQITLIFKCVP